ncbi:MAG: dephospho-CoA kinase [Syntrophobacterales bacterium]|nr:dephospho-CoA kinase [Syntrophobacterales bacterium]
MRRYPRIALTGGIASGKSTVASMLMRKGALIIDADSIAREVVEPGTDCWKALRSVLSPGFFEESGLINRRKLREAIVKNSEIKKCIEGIIHPAVISEMKVRWERAIAENPERIVIFDIPLLFEVNLQHRFDFVIVVYVPRSIQRERLATRDGISPDEAEKLIDIQKDIEFKKAHASALIVNDGSMEETAHQVDLLWNKLVDLWHNFSKSPEESRSLLGFSDFSSSPPSRTC